MKPRNYKLKSKVKPHVKTAVLVDLNIEHEEVNNVPTHSTLKSQNSGRQPETSSHDLIDLDSPEVSNQFGDPLEEPLYLNIPNNLN